MMNMSIKQDEQDPLMAGGEDGIVAGISGSAGPGEPRPPTLQVEHTTYGDNYPLEGQMISEQRMREILVELQQTWLKQYKLDREKLLVDLTEKLHQEYMSDLQRAKMECMAQYREEMEAERLRQEQNYELQLQEEVQRLSEKHRREVQMIKKKQWCWQCEQEAIYHCCWNTAYCSVECQQAHWPMHRRYCRRKKAQTSTGSVQANNSGSSANNSLMNGPSQSSQSNGTGTSSGR